jgi:D-beta-D-heptose 7-phosphate kinase/D-beta-D-heptose 1-phosphate adenosyltransferase
MATVCVSGGFDPLHEGHIRLISDASLRGDVVVILNSDAWLRRKKGYAFQPWLSRAYILRAVRGVKDVVPVDDSDGTVVEALARIRPDYFANGGDREAGNTPELSLCLDLGIKPLWGVGGEKVASSSEIVANARR